MARTDSVGIVLAWKSEDGRLDRLSITQRRPTVGHAHDRVLTLRPTPACIGTEDGDGRAHTSDLWPRGLCPHTPYTTSVGDTTPSMSR